jgi:hypothetical protein
VTQLKQIHTPYLISVSSILILSHPTNTCLRFPRGMNKHSNLPCAWERDLQTSGLHNAQDSNRQRILNSPYKNAVREARYINLCSYIIKVLVPPIRTVLVWKQSEFVSKYKKSPRDNSIP